MKHAYAYEVRYNMTMLLASAAGFMVCALLAQSGWVEPAEEGVMRLVYGLSSMLAPIFYGITQMGSLGAWLVVVLMALVFRRKQIAAVLFANGLLAYGAAYVAKFIVARPRPSLIYPDIVVRLEAASGYGFPSGHTAVATALALGLMPYAPKKYRWVLWVWVGAVGLSRVYLGVHSPLDVIGGLFIGASVASFTRLVFLSQKSPKKT